MKAKHHLLGIFVKIMVNPPTFQVFVQYYRDPNQMAPKMDTFFNPICIANQGVDVYLPTNFSREKGVLEVKNEVQTCMSL